jgi:methionyl-tRNA formyltransferase
MRYVIFGDESTIPKMVGVLGSSIELAVCASNRPQAFGKLKNYSQVRKKLYLQPPKNSTRYITFLRELEAHKPDHFFCFSYSMILCKQILGIARRGAINFHGGLLPEYRGANIINWVLVEGARETGVTSHYMTAGIDDGDIIFRERISISDEDTAKALKRKVDAIGFDMLGRIKNLLDQGKKLPRTPQDGSRSRYFRRRRPEDGLIVWRKSDEEIFNLVRALVHSWPGAFYFDRNGKKVILTSYHTIEEIRQIRKINGF